MRLAEDLFLVGGGSFNGFGLSTAADSHVYAFVSGEEILLVDCGMDHQGGLDAVWRNLRADGLDPQNITHIALTHYHVDHCGGLRSLLERVEARVVAGAETLAALAAGDVQSTGFALAQAGGLYPDDYILRPFPVWTSRPDTEPSGSAGPSWRRWRPPVTAPATPCSRCAARPESTFSPGTAFSTAGGSPCSTPRIALWTNTVPRWPPWPNGRWTPCCPGMGRWR